MGSAGLYWVIRKPNGAAHTTRADSSTTNGRMAGDDPAQHQRDEAEAEQRAQRQQEAVAAAKALTVSVNDYRVGFFGGIRNVRIHLRNPSQITFSSVVVKVNYYKENGGLYKSETVPFDNVEPESSLTQPAPDSDRGTRLTYKISTYRFAPPLDSLMHTASSDSLL